MRSGLLWALLGGTSLLLACQPQFSIPDGVTITCSAGDKCPTGYTCSEALGRCIRPGDDGLPLNVAGSPIWNTTNATAGTVLQVTFSSSKTLGMDPLVQLALPKDGSLRPFAQVRVNELQYVYSYRVTGDEGDGAAAVTVKLVDTFGKVADAQTLGSVQLIFTGLGVASDSVKITPSHVGSGAIVDIKFKPAVPGTTVTKVRVGNFQAIAVDPQPTDGTVAFQWGVQGSIEGALAVTADLTGPAGNTSPATPVGTVIIDYTAPTVVSTEIAKPMTHPGDNEVVIVTVSEPLAKVPQLDLGRGTGTPNLFTATVLSATRYRFEGTIRRGDVGTPVLTLSLAEDVAGNTASATQVGTITVADARPSLQNLTQVEPKSWVTVGDLVKVSFTTPGAVNAPDVKIALATGQSIAMTQDSMEPDGSNGGASYVYSHTIAANDPEGGAHVDVRLTDLFGNTAGPFSTGQFFIDRTAPLATAGVVVSPSSPVPIGALLVVTVNANKVLDHATLSSTPALTFSEPILSGTAAIWTHTVTSADATATYTFNSTIFDRAGNSTTVTPATVELDTGVPGAVAYSASPDFATVGTLVRTAFDATETLSEDPVVSLGSVAMTKDTSASSGSHFVYTHVVATGETQHALPITAVLTDVAGNTNSVVLGQVELDFTLFTAADISASAAHVAAGDTLTITAVAHKPVGTTSSLTVSAPSGLTFGAPTVNGQTLTWTHLVTSSDPVGPINVTVAVADEAEHAFPVPVTAIATIDPGT